MDIKQQILHFYRVEGLSLREISRRAGVDRKTVMRLINDYEAAIKANPETGVDDFLASRPKYSKRAYAPYKVIIVLICICLHKSLAEASCSSKEINKSYPFSPFEKIRFLHNYKQRLFSSPEF